jgi:8-oxo-dGTP pyrophosphatase MutT (NUDIX family)
MSSNKSLTNPPSIWGEPNIQTVTRIDYVLEDHIWAFAENRAAEIDAYWNSLLEKKPRLFNGRIMMMSSYRIDEEDQGPVLRGTGFETDFKVFQAWRDFGFPDQSVINCFAMAALRSADGAFMLGRMGPQTAAAGRLYFPAGTPDPSDLKLGRIDLDGSAIRELTEETGLTADDFTISPDWELVFDGPRLACMKPMQALARAEELAARCDAFLAQDKEPELTGLVPIFSETQFDAIHMPEFMCTYMRRMF